MWVVDTTSSTGRSASAVQRVLEQLQSARPRPGALDGDVGDLAAHQLEDPRPPVVARQDLERECRLSEFRARSVLIHRPVLVAHRGRRHPQRAVVESPDKGVRVDVKLRAARLLRVRADLPAAGNRGQTVYVHRVQVVGRLPLVLDAQHLPRLVERPEPGDVRHLHDLELHQRVTDGERFRHQAPHRLRIGAVDDVQVLPVREPVARATRERRSTEGCRLLSPDLVDSHVNLLSTLAPD